jgi:ribonuclease M5
MFYCKLTGQKDSKKRRIILGKELGIGYGNANQMLSRLNNYGISEEEFVNAISKIQKELGE